MSTAEARGRLFCFGLGYCGRRLAEALLDDGWRVAGTVREEAKRAAVARRRLDVLAFDGRACPDVAAALAEATHLLSAVPPDEAGDPVLRAHERDIVALPGLRWAGYLSTTGVYGDRQGGWVDEQSPLLPTGDRGQRRAVAEQAWLRLHREHGVPVHIFRLAGIYGPGRSALDTVRAGQARRIDKPGQVFSRIHVDDIVAVLRASMARPNPGAIYNVCDDDPAPPGDVIAHACTLLEAPVPEPVPFDSAQLSPMARSFYNDNKRVRNDRIKTELGIVLRYPDYRAGLKALLGG